RVLTYGRSGASMPAYDLAHATWRKSTYSGPNNGGGCVEVAPLQAAWRKSSYSGGSGQGGGVEVAPLAAAIGLRDSKNPTGPALVLDASGWSAFVIAARR